jgi:hypothetical protein
MLAIFLIVCSPAVGQAQHDAHDMSKMGEKPMVVFGAAVPMNRFASGTSWIPDAVSLPSQSWMSGDWHLMAHGYGFLQFDQQSGPRGASQLGSLNWGMLMASRPLGAGALQLRTMLSVDASTVGGTGYPLLLQTGESYNGVTIHDRQHPHDAFMEVAALYDHPITPTFAWELYVAPSGEPALGPPAFMHRPSSVDDLAAPLGHHWQDASHVSFGVVTTGLVWHRFKVEASAFNGREPDQHRWNFDFAPLQSYSARITANPSDRWSLSAGFGFIKSPEESDAGHSMHRALVSAQYGRALTADQQFAGAVIWGGMSHSDRPGVLHSVLAEAELADEERGSLFARAEFVQKTADDLALPGALGSDPERAFDMGSVSIGAVRTLSRTTRTNLGLGARFSLNMVGSALESTYGGRFTGGVMVFVRLRPRRSAPMVAPH